MNLRPVATMPVKSDQWRNGVLGDTRAPFQEGAVDG